MDGSDLPRVHINRVGENPNPIFSSSFFLSLPYPFLQEDTEEMAMEEVALAPGRSRARAGRWPGPRRARAAFAPGRAGAGGRGRGRGRARAPWLAGSRPCRAGLRRPRRGRWLCQDGGRASALARWGCFVRLQDGDRPDLLAFGAAVAHSHLQDDGEVFAFVFFTRTSSGRRDTVCLLKNKSVEHQMKRFLTYLPFSSVELVLITC
jgi:hypothetical protein